MKRNFEEWLSNFRESIADYKYYIDFETVYKNADTYKVELNMLNSLIGSKHIEEDFKSIYKRYPKVLEAIPILIAKRESSIFCMDSNGAINYEFNLNKRFNATYPGASNAMLNQYCYFLRETGIFDLLENRLVSNLYDYVIGVEVGLNSNGRKNRGGHLMEDIVESYIVKTGYKKGVNYFKEMYLSDIERITGFDLSTLSNSGETAKRFDFVIFGSKCVYACECNFYASGGSKLNETARSYKTLALESKGISGFKFVWFTDGIGWISARNNLKETFDVLDDIYCIDDLEKGILYYF